MNNNSNKSKAMSLSTAIVGATLAVAGLGYCVTLQSSVHEQREAINRMQQHM